MKIALLGHGVESQSAYRYLSRHYPNADFTIYDEKSVPKMPVPDGATFKGNVKSFHDIDADLILRTPPIAPDRISGRGEISSGTKLFFKECPAPIIGVTGSKGKGTTVSLIAGILKAAGKTVHVVGNIGNPALDVLDEVAAEDIVVFELSSFQLWDMRQSPEVAVVLMIEPDHLEVHAGMPDYVAAKANIAKYQTPDDTIVYFASNDYTRRIGEASAGRKVPYPDDHSVHIRDDFFWYEGIRLCPVSSLKLPGAHNLDNAMAAIAAVWRWVKDAEVIAHGLSSFEGLPHRLKFVREVDGAKYYDDSIATTPGSAMAALRAFREPKVIILGGSSKGADFTELAAVVKREKVRKVLLIGEEAQRIAQALDSQGFVEYEILGKTAMTNIVAAAKRNAHSGDVVIMSPSCASFDMFKSYVDRGEQFVSAVMSL